MFINSPHYFVAKDTTPLLMNRVGNHLLWWTWRQRPLSQKPEDTNYLALSYLYFEEVHYVGRDDSLSYP